MKSFLGIAKGRWCGSGEMKRNINEVKKLETQAAGGHPKFLVKKRPKVIKQSLTRLA